MIKTPDISTFDHQMYTHMYALYTYTQSKTVNNSHMKNVQ